MNRCIPLIDLKQWITDPSGFVEQLRKACSETGFFLLRHDIPSEVVNRAMKEAEVFFDRPPGEKESISYENSYNFRGYMRMGVENTSGQTDFREQIEYAVETPAAESNALPFYDRLKGVNPWPDSIQPTLKPAINQLAIHLTRIASELVEAMSVALPTCESAHPLLELFRSHDNINYPPHWALKLAHYPSNTRGFGVGPHVDTNFLTLILQDSCGGLQVWFNNEWINVPATEGTAVLVCNLGELAELHTCGVLKATPHRVLATSHSRISIPFFYNPPLCKKIVSMTHQEESNSTNQGSTTDQ